MADTPFRTVGAQYGRDRTLIRTINLTYWVRGPLEEGQEIDWQAIDDFEPDAPLGLKEADRQAHGDEAGDLLLTVKFEGIIGDGAGGGTLEYDNASVESPIETFSKFALLNDKYGPAVFDPTSKQFLGWKRKTNIGEEEVNNPLYGTSHFLEGNTTLRVTFVTRDFKPELLANLNKIWTPIVPAGLETSIQTPEGMTWLKKHVCPRFRQNCWEWDIESWLGRWIPDIYQPTT